MQASKDEIEKGHAFIFPNIERPITTKTAQIINMDLLALDLKNLNPRVIPNPSNAPRTKEPIISTKGQTKMSITLRAVFPAKAFEIEKSIAMQ